MTAAAKQDIGARPDRERAKRGRGVLPTLILLFSLSAAVRLTSGASHALETTAAPATGAAANCPESPGPEELLAAIREREANLTTRSAMLDEREAALELARGEIENRLARLREAEADLARTLTIAEEAADADVARLVTVYEAMKPKEASRLFSEMDPAFSSGFLSRMRPESAAAILAGMDASRAYAISAEIAGRNAAAPEN